MKFEVGDRVKLIRTPDCEFARNGHCVSGYPCHFLINSGIIKGIDKNDSKVILRTEDGRTCSEFTLADLALVVPVAPKKAIRTWLGMRVR